MDNIVASRTADDRACEVGNIDVEGIILPNVPLSDTQIEDAVKRLNIPNFRGWYCIDTLPKICHKVECGIPNLDKSDGRGTHWVAWYVNNGKKIFFNSSGNDPPLELVKYLSPGRAVYSAPSIYCSTDNIQPRDTVVCGHLCLYVLKKLSDGMEYVDVINSLI
jgi:hypothetical protein